MLLEKRDDHYFLLNQIPIASVYTYNIMCYLGVTTFVQIEMAWKCPKVASSIKAGLKDLKKARDKCVTILRESNSLLRFFEKVSSIKRI